MVRLKVPKQFRVSGIRVRVKVMPLKDLHGRSNLDPGDKDYGFLEIDEKEYGHGRQVTFLHEILHLIDCATASNLKESTVARLSYVLADVLEQLEPEDASVR